MAGSAGALGTLAQLLREDEGMLRKALTSKHFVVGGDNVEQRFTKDKAYDARDALAKALYAKLFSWIVGNVNRMAEPPDEKKLLAALAAKTRSHGGPGRAAAPTTIGRGCRGGWFMCGLVGWFVIG